MNKFFNKNTILVIILLILLFITFINYTRILKKYLLLKELKKNVDVDKITKKVKSNQGNIVIKAEDIPNVKWPFRNLKDQDNKNVNLLCVTAHMTEEHKKKFLEHYNKGIKFIGCSSYLSYPRLCDNKSGYCHLDDRIRIDGKYIEDYVIGWCHCFKEPDKFIKGNIPKILISESDFNSDRLKPTNDKLEYDYLTVQPKDRDCKYSWLSYCKNWGLAEKTIQVLTDNLNLKGVVVGRVGCDIDIKNKDLVIIEPTEEYNKRENRITIPYGELIDKMNKSKFILLPNLEDASPRVLVEALSLNKPVLVNETILGGWKYVNEKTGEFYNENNIKEQTEKLLRNIENNQYSPREYYTSKYGTVNSGKRFKKFLKSIYPDLSECEYVKFPI